MTMLTMGSMLTWLHVWKKLMPTCTSRSTLNGPELGSMLVMEATVLMTFGTLATHMTKSRQESTFKSVSRCHCNSSINYSFRSNASKSIFQSRLNINGKMLEDGWNTTAPLKSTDQFQFGSHAIMFRTLHIIT